MQPVDALLSRGGGEVGDQQRSEPDPLEIVGHADPQLSDVGSLGPDELGSPDDPFVFRTARQDEERLVAFVVDIDGGAGRRTDVQGGPPEPEEPRLRRQTYEVVLDRSDVLWARGS